jgi:hypothetical protein
MWRGRLQIAGDATSSALPVSTMERALSFSDETNTLPVFAASAAHGVRTQKTQKEDKRRGKDKATQEIPFALFAVLLRLLR